MKIKTNVRAGAQTRTQSSKVNNTVVVYVPPISRCVGL